MKQKTRTYPFILLAGLPLLVLAGCASNESTPINDEMNITQTETADPSPAPVAEFTTAVQPTAVTEPVTSANTATGETQSGESVATELYPSGLVIVEPAEHIVGFGFDQAEVDAQYLELLKQHAEYLSSHPQLALQVEGHTDSTGPKAYNEWLSKQRAEAVVKYLVEQGAPEDQISVAVYADTAPRPDAIHQRDNRRVELNYQDQRMVSK